MTNTATLAEIILSELIASGRMDETNPQLYTEALNAATNGLNVRGADLYGKQRAPEDPAVARLVYDILERSMPGLLRFIDAL